MSTSLHSVTSCPIYSLLFMPMWLLSPLVTCTTTIHAYWINFYFTVYRHAGSVCQALWGSFYGRNMKTSSPAKARFGRPYGKNGRLGGYIGETGSINMAATQKKSTFWPRFPIHSFRHFFARTYRFATIQNVTDGRTTDDGRQTDDILYHRLDR